MKYELFNVHCLVRINVQLDVASITSSCEILMDMNKFGHWGWPGDILMTHIWSAILRWKLA